MKKLVVGIFLTSFILHPVQAETLVPPETLTQIRQQIQEVTTSYNNLVNLYHKVIHDENCLSNLNFCSTYQELKRNSATLMGNVLSLLKKISPLALNGGSIQIGGTLYPKEQISSLINICNQFKIEYSKLYVKFQSLKTWNPRKAQEYYPKLVYLDTNLQYCKRFFKDLRRSLAKIQRRFNLFKSYIQLLTIEGSIRFMNQAIIAKATDNPSNGSTVNIDPDANEEDNQPTAQPIRYPKLHPPETYATW